MRKLTANYIFTLDGKPLKNGIITVDNSGKIIDIIDTNGEIKEIAGLEYYNGVIVPGFVNAHCHLELSHMKGIIDNTTVKGLPGFVDEIISKRFFPDNLNDIIKRADFEMKSGGIIAVGDISNTQDSFKVKSESKMYYQTFIELFTNSNAASQENFDNGLENLKILRKYNLEGSLVPHAPYSVPDKLFELIGNFESEKQKVISIHNQETPSENELFTNQTGEMKKVLESKGFNYADIKTEGESSLKATLPKLNKNDNILLIHNTFTEESDIEFAEKYSENIYWVFCPNSNLYIEKALPKFEIFYKNNVKTCLGTDSYSSNTELSILSEMKTLQDTYKELSFEKILETACLNGAKALKIDGFTGKLKPGFTPGINLIENFDFINMKLKKGSSVKPIL